MILAVVTAIYWPGLSGGWLFDDYPNIVDNHGVQPTSVSVASLVGAALSSPASDFKRPLSSLSFAANYLAGGLDPYWMKLTNLVIHLLNGLLVFELARRLLACARCTRMEVRKTPPGSSRQSPLVGDALTPDRTAGKSIAHQWAPTTGSGPREWFAVSCPGEAPWVAMLIAAGWMVLPINLTGVLYVVQRMESLATLFVLLGLIGYVAGRGRMLAGARGGLTLCAGSLVLATGVGVLAKETAVMLPLYALLVEWVLFGFRAPAREHGPNPRDWRIVALFVLVLLLPMLLGLAWLLPRVLAPESWATRDFDLSTRLLSEARIVVGYIGWTLLPLPHELGFYHDDVVVSTGLLHPWTTLGSLLALAGMVALVIGLRRRWPLVSLGLALFLGCHLLTGTILPLELVYEHRNYFASFGLLLALVPLLVGAPEGFPQGVASPCRSPLAGDALPHAAMEQEHRPRAGSYKGIRAGAVGARTLRYVVLGALLAWWAGLTAYTAWAWGEPLRLAQQLAWRAPGSPRAQYELGRTYIIYSHYDPGSPYTREAYAPLERAAALPDSSILPQQALIFMNSRMHLPLKDAWWTSMTAKLKARRPGVQDESSLAALVQCAREGSCGLPQDRMVAAFEAALAHPEPSARLLATYGDYAWNLLDDRARGERLTAHAVRAAPAEPAYRITLARMLLALDRPAAAREQVRALQDMNLGGRFDSDIDSLSRQIATATSDR